MSHDVVSWVEALGVWAAVGVALFFETVRDWLYGPKLVVRVGPPHLSVQKTEALAPPSGTPYPVYFCHLEVANEGARAAREVEVFVSEVHRFHDAGWVVEERFIPEWLWWVTLRQVAADVRRIYLPTLPPHARR